jgi:hypothetical protein
MSFHPAAHDFALPLHLLAAADDVPQLRARFLLLVAESARRVEKPVQLTLQGLHLRHEALLEEMRPTSPPPENHRAWREEEFERTVVRALEKVVAQEQEARKKWEEEAAKIPARRPERGEEGDGVTPHADLAAGAHTMRSRPCSLAR